VAALVGIGLVIATRSPVTAAVFMVVFALGEGPSWPTIMSLASKRFAHRSSLAIGLIAAAGSLGAIFGPFVMGLLAARFGFSPGIMLFPAAVVLLNIANFSLIGGLMKKG